jgi:6-pyruvoyltetrahydropterin/6-carboxytetrahydropterin synthase
MAASMWEISAEILLAARHQIRGVPDEGGRVHAHRWAIKAFVRAAALDRIGWVLDFQELERALRRLVAPYEGAFINDVPPWNDVNPTRENLARFIAEGLARELGDGRARVHRVDVSEGAHCASFLRD